MKKGKIIAIKVCGTRNKQGKFWVRNPKRIAFWQQVVSNSFGNDKTKPIYISSVKREKI